MANFMVCTKKFINIEVRTVNFIFKCTSMGQNMYCMCAIITRGLYIINPVFESFSDNFV